MGFKISPYLAVEAHLVSCGGFATQGTGPFDIHKAIAWLKKWQVKVAPTQPDFAAEIVKRERTNHLLLLDHQSNASMLLPKVAIGQKNHYNAPGKSTTRRNAAVMRSLDVTRHNKP